VNAQTASMTSIHKNIYAQGSPQQPEPCPGLWVVCPVCSRFSPVGSHFCITCWAMLAPNQGVTFSREDVERLTEKRLAQAKRKRRIKAAMLCAVFLALFLAGLHGLTDVFSRPPAGLSSDSAAGQWAMFRHDPARSGTLGREAAVPRGRLKWSFRTGGAIHSSPAVAGETVFFGSRDGRLYALDTRSGEKRWEFRTGSWVESSPAVVGGMVYFGSNDGTLYALDVRTGRQMWGFKTRYPIMSSPAVAQGTVYFGADDYHIYALDAAQGTRLWTFKTEGYVKSSPVVSEGILYAGCEGSFCYALHAGSGKPRLHFRSHRPVTASPAVGGTTVYFMNDAAQLFAVDGRARNWPGEHAVKPYWLQLWAFGLPIPAPPNQSGFLWALRLGMRCTSSPVLTGDALYLGVDNALLSFDLGSRSTRWRFQTGRGPMRSSPALARSTLFVGSENGRLYAVDAETGEHLWDIVTEGPISASPTVSDGVVFVGSQDGRLYAVE